MQTKAKGDFSEPKENVDKDKAIANQEHIRDIKCLRCLGRGHIASQYLNKRTILMRDSTYKSGDEDDDLDEMPKLEDCSDDKGGNMLTLIKGKSLVARQALNTQLKVKDGDK